jgi:predicted amidohydrolase YtcJ
MTMRLNIATLCVVASFSIALSGCGSKEKADQIFIGGPVVTMNDANRTAEAVAIKDGRILAVGTESEVMSHRGSATVVTDLDGMTLMPGFVDSHGHFMNALQVVTWANVSPPPVGPGKDIASVVDAMKAHAEKQKPAPGEWIVGYGYDGNELTDGRELTVDDLDTVFPDNPVMILHVSNHGAVLNSAGFKKVGISAQTPTPEGGVILRKNDGSNRPSGLIMETALIPLFANMPQPSEQEMLDTFAAAQEIYTSKGTTTVSEGATSARDFALLRKAADQGRLVVDIVSLPFGLDAPSYDAMVEKQEFSEDDFAAIVDAAADKFGKYENRFKIGGVKFTIDGSPQGRTAWWTEPLLTSGPGGEQNWSGQPIMPVDLYKKAFKILHDRGIRVFSHANGDAAVDLAIEAAREAGVTPGQDMRHAVIHSQFMRPEQIDAYAELGLVPSFFTVHTFLWGDQHWENTGERANFISPLKAAQNAGIRFSNHNDFSVTPVDPMFMMQTAMLRTTRSGRVLGEDQRVDAWTALKALTIDGAYFYKEEDSKGSIEVGKLADLVILDGNPLTTEPQTLTDIGIVETFKEGKSIYRRGD